MNLSFEQEKKYRFQLVLLSIFGSVVILLLKWLAYKESGSTALKSDALESVVNVVASGFALGALLFAEQPADDDHPYGHGKIEYFSAAFEGGLIALASLLIFIDAVKVLIEGPQLKDLGMGLIINSIAGSLNGILGYILVHFGKKFRSEALHADGQHILSDFYTTIALLIGVLIVKLTKLYWLDAVIAMGVSIMLARTGYLLVKKSSAALLDSVDLDTIEKLVRVIANSKPIDIITIHELRAIRAGRYTHVDIHLVVPEYLEVGKSHDLVEKYCISVIREAKIEGEFHPHIDPCRKLYCANCEVNDCKIRTAPFSQKLTVTKESATAQGPAEALF